mmetsp:Transcript_10625/g.19398  ORF Transcript_10625/g.19398 Transcript_10625/m.19398 type:complete len:501 (+) Transcript_10625:84-1586(+)|eukprot:CAMPEP_0197523092 /NCGR_PEP_ID=MMETSP1318-20131121/8097_1 /TAXON_ID=552666 /ORGANISM="Partenskyella glossopodia, Strain RCC365" /LENGTH=500 /DNA_ID=CAMNT_0043075669 /DNA_START=80 /DNA_END=1585 /DNA_ORIENTATION=+
MARGEQVADTGANSPQETNATTEAQRKIQAKLAKYKAKNRPMIGDYYLGKKLGGGATAIARIGIHHETGKKVALKVLWKLKESESRVRAVKNELKALEAVSKHPNIVRLLDVDWTGKYPHKDGSVTDAAIITLELAANGELFDYLMHTGSFSEEVARTYFTQLVDGLSACHDKGVVHRDLKPDNLLLDAKYILKIADFGFSAMPEDGEMYTSVGTEKYMAPEVVKGMSYTKGCDVWSCGVVLFVMYAGYPPYVKPSRSDWWFDKLLKGNFKYFWMAHEQQRTFEDDFKDLINQMLTTDSAKRITLDGIRKHPWMTKKTLEQDDLVRELARRKPAVDTAKLEEGLDRKNNSVEFAAGMRGTAGKAIGSIPVPPKLIELDLKSLPEAEEYEPDVKSYTVVQSMFGPPKTLQYILSVLTQLGSIKFSRDGYSVECKTTLTSGTLEFAVDVFAEEDGAVAEFRRLAGNFHEFRKFFQQLQGSFSRLDPNSKEKKTASTEEKKAQ